MTDLFSSNEPWFAAAVILVVGILIAAAIAASVNQFARRVLGDPAQGTRLATIAFTVTTAIAAVVALGRLAGPTATDAGLTVATTRLLAGIPNLLIALLVLLLGWMLAVAVRTVVGRVVVRVPSGAGDVLVSLAFWGVLVLTGLTAAEQVGIDLRFLEWLLLVVLGGIVLGSALAFGLGSRDLLSAVIAGRHVARIVRVGDEIVCGDHRGRVALLGHASVRLDTADGVEVEIPNAQLLAHAVQITQRAEAPTS